jgi:hypothetical protein
MQKPFKERYLPTAMEIYLNEVITQADIDETQAKLDALNDLMGNPVLDFKVAQQLHKIKIALLDIEVAMNEIDLAADIIELASLK